MKPKYTHVRVTSFTLEKLEGSLFPHLVLNVEDVTDGTNTSLKVELDKPSTVSALLEVCELSEHCEWVFDERHLRVNAEEWFFTKHRGATTVRVPFTVPFEPGLPDGGNSSVEV